MPIIYPSSIPSNPDLAPSLTRSPTLDPYTGTIHDDADGTEILSINDAANVVVDEVWARPKPNQPAAQEQEQCTVM